MTSIGPRCHELRIPDGDANWRIIYRMDSDHIVIAEVFKKKTRKTLEDVIAISRERLGRYDHA